MRSSASALCRAQHCRASSRCEHETRPPARAARIYYVVRRYSHKRSSRLSVSTSSYRTRLKDRLESRHAAPDKLFSRLPPPCTLKRTLTLLHSAPFLPPSLIRPSCPVVPLPPAFPRSTVPCKEKHMAGTATPPGWDRAS